jgi:hypothetical protein
VGTTGLEGRGAGKWLNVPEVLERLGGLKSPVVIYRLIAAGAFPGAARPCKAWLIPAQDVENFIARGRR